MHTETHESTARKRVTGARAETIESLARRMFDESGRDHDEAVDLLVAQFRRRPALHEEIFREYAGHLVNDVRLKDNAAIRSGKANFSMDVNSTVTSIQSAASKSAGASRMQRFAVKLTGLYMQTFSYNGEKIVLGLATPEKLRPIAAQYIGQGATMVRTGRWIERIIASGKEGKPIHESISLKELERMQREANETPV